MRSVLRVLGLVLTLAAISCAPAPKAPGLTRNWPATVWIRNGDAFGCGVVIWEAGLILTAAHVVAEDGPVTVLFPGKGGSDTGVRLPATIIATSPDDLALLRVANRFADAVWIADANDAEPGDQIYGIMIYPILRKLVGRGYVARTHVTMDARSDDAEKTRDVLMVHYPGVSGSSGSGVYRAGDDALLGINTMHAVFKTESGDLDMNLAVPGYKIIKFLDAVKAPYHPASRLKPVSPRKKWPTDDHTDPS